MSDKTKVDPFDSADLYTCSEDAEEYDAETPENTLPLLAPEMFLDASGLAHPDLFSNSLRR
jgi:hypothetical protein